MKHLIITVIGQDRPGLVETLSDTVYQNQGNWLSSSLSKLAGQFTGILQVEVADQYVGVLSSALSQLDDLQVQIVEEESKTLPTSVVHHLLVTGNDRSGIVKDVTTKLNQLGINIHKLKTQITWQLQLGLPDFLCPFPVGAAK